MSESSDVRSALLHLGPRVSRRVFLRLAGLATAALSSTRMFSSDVSPRSISDDAVDPSALPIWCDEHGLGRNVFAHFRLSLVLSTAPAQGELHLFADTRYRLRVNGRIVSYGPGAFLIAYPEFDSIDLTPWLCEGENEIAVEVNSRGDSSFQAEPSRGGFVAWGQVRAADGAVLGDLATPGSWEARRSPAWAAESPPFSFAQGPVEIVSLAALPADGNAVDHSAPDWHAPAIVPRSHWGALTPRSVPKPTFDLWKPQRILTLAPLASPQFRVSAHRSLPRSEPSTVEQRFAAAVWLHAKRSIETVLSTNLGDYWLNGERLTAIEGDSRVLESRWPVRLQSGWNLLYAELPAPGRLIGLVIGWPHGDDIEAHALPEFGDHANKIRLTPLLPIARLHALRGSVPTSAADLERFGATLDSGENHTAFLSREVAWDTPIPTELANPADVDEREIPRSPAGEGIVVYDFGREFIGHILLEIDAPKGGIVDVTNEELQRADGAVRMFQPNAGINPVDRIHLRHGLSRWEGFHARGGRLVQLTVRSSGPVVIRTIALRNALVRVPASGAFACSDPVFDWAWTTGVATLEASLTDGWVDPWREQGLYIGDVLVEYLAHRAWSRDTTHIVRALRMWARAQLPNGQLQAVVPSYFLRPHADYTLLWIVILRDYVRHTGDRALADELWPCVERIWQSSAWKSDAHGLWSGDGVNVFGDWGATEAAIEGDANGILNAFRVGALDASAELAIACNRPDRATQFKRERENVAAAFRRVLWDEQKNAFAPCMRDGAFVDTFAGHANALALLYRIAAPEQESGALALVRTAIARAAAAPLQCVRRGGHLELYFLHYVLELFGERGLHADAENVIQHFWGMQRDHGAWCLWEAFYRGLRQQDSQCHGWSAGPSVYFHRFVLGIEATPDHVTITPSSATLTQAQGVHPHPRGDIAVNWRVAGDAFHLEVDLPTGVTHEVRPGATFAHLSPRVSVRIR